MLIRCIDLETTGMPSETERHAVCEVGYVDLIDARHYTHPVSILCNPGRPMPVEARAVHHLSDADLHEAGPPEAAFRELMNGPPDYFAAHNADFERHFFAGGDVPWVCTYKAALRLWPDAPGHGLQVLRYHLDLALDPDAAMPPHRAGPDAYVCAFLLARILADGRASLDDMVRWSNGPALQTTIMFGKHRGQRWDALPADYLEWIIHKSDLDRDAKANARHYLKLRQGARA